MVDEPTEEERLDFVRSYGVEPVDVNTDLTFKDAAETVAEMTPIIGDAMAAKEIYDELQKEDPDYRFVAVLGGAGLIGAIPGIGDVAAKGIRNAADMIKRIEVDPDALGSLGGNIRLKPKEQSVWSYPEQLYDSADTSINVSKKPAGYNELKKRGEIKDGDVIVDIGGGRFDNLVEDAAEEGATVKVYDPFNRTPEHNAAVVDSVKDGQADMAMSHNVLNVIQEDKNIIDIAVQAENAIKPNGKAHFSVYEGTGKGEGKVTTKGYQRNEKTQAYVPLIEQVFGEGNVTRKGKIITATKNAQGFSEGGMAIEEQMAMNFGDVPDNTIGIDPVSGNEIPMGSTAENVRDDIPANLSEGEIVVPADVVNFHGVKLFEDLRAEAKMGYAQMADDGRMGGEPMDDMGMDIELSELDLEVMDDEAPVQMNRGGTSMADYKDVAKNRNIKAPKRTAPRKTHAEIMAQAFGSNTDSRNDKKDNSPEAISKRVQARKNKPKNRFEAIRNRLRDVFKDDDDNQSRFDFGFSGNPMERAARKYGSPASATNNESLRAGQVAGAYTGGQEPVNNSVRFHEQPFYKRLMEGLGFDEGGLATDEVGINPPEQPHLIGGEDQFNQPFYDPDQKGGFDMENAYTDYGDGTGGGPLLEMREYMNDEGHRIFITFINGVPQMEIPPGYYPVEGEGVAVAPTPAVGGSGGSDMGDDGNAGGIPPELMPTPINYKELTMEELTQMVEDQKNMKGDVIAGGISYLSPIVGGAIKVAMWNTTRQTKAEIIRRRDDPYTSEVDKRRYDSLLEISEREEPGLIATLFGKLTGNDPSAPAVRTDAQTDALYAQLDKMTQAYTPDVQTASNRTTPGVDDGYSNEIKTQIQQASADAASAAFGSPSKTVKPVGNDDFIEAVKQDPDSFLPPTSTNDNNDSPIVRPPTPAPKPSPIYDNVAAGDYDDDSTGVYKGGMMRKKKKKKKSK